LATTPAEGRIGVRLALVLLGVGLLVALALRLVLAGSGGNVWDLDIYKAWARIIAERGVVHAYDGPVVVDYPPVFLYWLEFAVRLYQAWLSPSLDTSRLAFTYFVRLPGIALDLVLAALIFLVVRRRAGDGWALAAAFAYAFNPAVLFNLAYWGMPDSPHAIIIVGALLLALARRPFLAWALISVGVFTKPQADIFAPLVALITLREQGWRGCVRGAAGIVAGVLVATGPFLLAGTADGILAQMLAMADYDPFISNNAHNLWWLIGWGYGWQIRDTEPFLGALSYRVTAIILVAVFYAFALWRAWRTRDETRTLEVAAYLGLLLFMLMTVVHETHAYTVLPLLSLIWWRERALRWLYGALSALFIANLVLHDAGIYGWLQDLGLHYRHLSLTLVNAVAYSALFGWWTLRVGGVQLGRQALPAGLAAVGMAGAVVFATSPQLVSASYDPARIGQPSGATFGDQIRLVGYSFKPDRVRPGEAVQFSFTWQPLRDLDEHYMLFVHLLNPALEKGGQRDGPPTRNVYPTRYWRAGEAIHDERSVQVAPTARPGVYAVEIGFYPVTDFKRLPVRTPDGRTDTRLVLGRIVVTGPPATTPALALDRPLDDGIRLVGITAHPDPSGGAIRLAPGTPLRLDLVWEASATPSIDYTVFVQLLDENGRVAAQHDGQPQDGRYPTTAWVAGDRIGETVTLVAPAPGEYRLIVGMYELASGRRLSAGDTNFVEALSVQVRR
jgi:Gpi18-like mannosyltransferase